MILPTKELSPGKSLIVVGGDILDLLGDASLSVSGLWAHVQERRATTRERISYDWFILGLDLLYLIGAIEKSDQGLLRKVA